MDDVFIGLPDPDPSEEEIKRWFTVGSDEHPLFKDESKVPNDPFLRLFNLEMMKRDKRIKELESALDEIYAASANMVTMYQMGNGRGAIALDVFSFIADVAYKLLKGGDDE